MATPPDFTAGAVLTAAQMNGIGLWLVKTQTIGSAVATVTVTDAFSADYANYRIVVNGGTASSTQAMTLQLGSTTTGYYSAGFYVVAGTTTVVGYTDNNTANFTSIGRGDANNLVSFIDLILPFATKRTYVNNYYNNGSTTVNNVTFYGGGYLNDATSYTAFTLGISGGATMTGGEIRVYGYRN